MNEKKSIDLTTSLGRLNEKKTGGLRTLGEIGEKKVEYSVQPPVRKLICRALVTI